MKKIWGLILIVSVMFLLFLFASVVYADGYELYSIELAETVIGDNSVSFMSDINTSGAISVSDPGTATYSYSAGGSRLYKFVPQTTGFYSIKSVSTNNSTTLSLYDETGTFIMNCGRGRAGDNLQDFHMGEVLMGGKTYYVKVESSNAKTFPVYFYADDYTDGTTVANPLTIGENLNAKINYTADRDVFSFIPLTSGEYTIRISGNAGVVAKIYTDVEHTVADIIQTTDVGNEYTVTADFVSGKVYHIDVFGESTLVTGDYTINVSINEENETAPTKFVDIETNSVKKILMDPAEVIMYKLDIRKSGSYNFITNYDTDLNIYVCNGTGAIKGVFQPEYEGGQLYSLHLNLDTNQAYYLVVRNYISRYKDFSIEYYYDDFADCFNSAEQLGMQALNGEIEHSGDRDVFLIQKGYIRLMSDYKMKVRIINASTYGTISSANGKEILINNNYDKAYLIVENNNSDGIGKYSLKFNSSSLNYTTLQTNGVYSVNITSAGNTKLFKYTPVESGYYLMDIGGINPNYTVELYDYCSNLLKNGTMNFQMWLDKDNTYFIEVGMSDNMTGNFNFSFFKDDYESESGRNGNYIGILNDSEYIEGEIDSSTDFDYFNVFASGIFKIKNVFSGNLNLLLVAQNGDLISSGSEITVDFSQYQNNPPAIAVTGDTKKYKIIMESQDGSIAVPFKKDEIVNIEVRDVLPSNESGAYTITFSSADFSLFDGNGLTFKPDTAIGETGRGVAITNITDSSVTFSVTGDNVILNDVVNIVRFRAKREGVSHYTIEKTVVEEE